jgi:butyrate kinase
MSVAVHKKGKMIDSVDANGEASFSPERSGVLRVDDFAKWVIESGKPFSEIRKILTRKAGFFAHLGTTNGKEIEARIKDGDKHAEDVFSAMAYNISKNIGALATTVNGRIDGIILTGGLAHSKMFVEMIKARVSFIAEVTTIAGEREMEALNEGALRVLSNKERARIYPNGDLEL